MVIYYSGCLNFYKILHFGGQDVVILYKMEAQSINERAF
jgi:hypothetical protein